MQGRGEGGKTKLYRRVKACLQYVAWGAVSLHRIARSCALYLCFGGVFGGRTPRRHRTHTDLLDLDPLPRKALHDPLVEAMYERRFTHFNPIQTQAFHTLFHTDESVLLGAPTGSGKTISSELTILRLFKHHPGQKAPPFPPSSPFPWTNHMVQFRVAGHLSCRQK